MYILNCPFSIQEKKKKFGLVDDVEDNTIDEMYKNLEDVYDVMVVSLNGTEHSHPSPKAWPPTRQ